MAFRVHVAIGDPQAPFSTVLAILDRHRLLERDGRLRPDVQLVSMGDHFDWGPPGERRRATDDAVDLLSWLSAHPPEQVILLAGNHDLARVCELEPFSRDEDFEAAVRRAVTIYRGGAPDEAEQAAFLRDFPHVPDVECLARDFSCFSTAQQRLVTELLRTDRFRLAHAHRGLLLVHAGVTLDDLALLGAPSDDASAVAAHLNAFLEQRVAVWAGGPLDLSPVHQPGSAAHGVARGIFFHRPAAPKEGDPQFVGPPRRRFDPRRLPPAFPQAIGHIRDKKCRELLGDWCAPGQPLDGPLRALSVEGDVVRYERGTPARARLFFLDGGMLHTAPERYELLDLDTRLALSPARSS